MDTMLVMLWMMCWQTAVLAAAVWVVARLARKAPASWRHALWVVVLVKMFVPPVAQIPAGWAFWQSSAPAPVVTASAPVVDTYSIPEAARPESPMARSGLIGTEPVVEVFNNPGPAATSPAPSPIDWRLVGAASWLAGVAVMTLLLIGGHRRLGWLVRCSRPAGAEWMEMLESAAGPLGVRKLPQIRFTDSASTPVLAGFAHPVILLPSGIEETCSGSDLFAILSHELAHIRRRDAAVAWLQQIARAVFFFHPAVWLAGREIRRERELACDEMVLSRSPIAREQYASGYLSALRLASQTHWETSAIAMAEPFDIEKKRLKMILHNAVPKMTARWVAAILLVAAVGLPTIAGIGQAAAKAIESSALAAFAKTHSTTTNPKSLMPQLTLPNFPITLPFPSGDMAMAQPPLDIPGLGVVTPPEWKQVASADSGNAPAPVARPSGTYGGAAGYGRGGYSGVPAGYEGNNAWPPYTAAEGKKQFTVRYIAVAVDPPGISLEDLSLTPPWPDLGPEFLQKLKTRLPRNKLTLIGSGSQVFTDGSTREFESHAGKETFAMTMRLETTPEDPNAVRLRMAIEHSTKGREERSQSLRTVRTCTLGETVLVLSTTEVLVICVSPGNQVIAEVAAGARAVATLIGDDGRRVALITSTGEGPVYAAAEGVIKNVQKESDGTYFVEIDYRGGINVGVYCSGPTVRAGDRVSKGTLIAERSRRMSASAPRIESKVGPATPPVPPSRPAGESSTVVTLKQVQASQLVGALFGSEPFAGLGSKRGKGEWRCTKPVRQVGDDLFEYPALGAFRNVYTRKGMWPPEGVNSIAWDDSKNTITLFGDKAAIEQFTSAIASTDVKPKSVTIKWEVYKETSHGSSKGLKGAKVSGRAIPTIGGGWCVLMTQAARAALDSAVQAGKLRLVNAPIVTTMSNQEASIQVSRGISTIPGATGEANTDEGPLLDVTPRVNGDGTVTCHAVYQGMSVVIGGKRPHIKLPYSVLMTKDTGGQEATYVVMSVVEVDEGSSSPTLRTN